MINKVNKSIIIFCVFAFGFLLSNLVRSITATLTPVLTFEFDLTAGNLGLLAGGYFIGFSIMQIPVGLLLDKIGPKKGNWLFFNNSIDWNNIICTCKKFYRIIYF